MSKNCAIILAAGKGVRMRAGVNKQYIELGDRPVIYYTLKAFEHSDIIDDIIIVAAKDEIEYCRKEVVEKYKIEKVSKIVEGGKERQDSVVNGLEEIEKCDIVLIHDGARPFVNKRIIEDGIKYAKKYGAAACGVPPKDTIKIRYQDGFSKETLKRNELFCVQTPQTFQYKLILNCHRKLNKDNVRVTDDTMVVERYGNKVYLYEGDYNNIKITTPEDLIICRGLLDNY
ncbi:2-C-methyl-D-erythritol 4-phosphate cytidylyltransferase [Clostridium sp. KNHs214]|uniref:2-C-methyl-D-erythritol 4-phosphate cytidylyltransferase n=1 Tax=Clostridium sp. KNHs214 TaxID=1540257 RepID=UPI0005543517|nr:2-C-methyl-D-erythritol 4-phosphate cytidylyltransferase [Clostridium sp. KNHs214]